MMHLPILPVLIPLLSGIVLLIAKQFGHNTQRVLSVAMLLLLTVVSVYALVHTLSVPHTVYMLGNWEAPFGIVLVLDKLSISMVLLTSVLALGALWYSISEDIDKKGAHFHVLFHLQIFGLNGAFLTGDLFNLFVFFEILLLASYSLLLHGQSTQRTKAGLHYVIINLVGSTLFLFAVGALYGILGTLNIADLAHKIAHLDPQNVGVVAAAGLLLLFVFGLKAAMFPLYLWLPNAYARTSAPVAALFAIMTKVGIYSILRVHGTLFGEFANDLAYYYIPWVLSIGIITLIMATFGVMSAQSLSRQIAYLVLASVSVLLISVGINTHEALSGTLYYMLHSTLVAGGFFLLANIIINARQSDCLINKTAPFENAKLLGSLFFIFAIAISGLPPFSGFLGKVMILQASITHEYLYTIFFVILASSLLIVMSLAKSGTLLFYDILSDKNTIKNSISKSSYAAIAFLFLSVPILVLFANPISDFTYTVAFEILDINSYVEAVLQKSLKGV
jgi:multicomponent K+:H+ antiporter subunit D